MATSTNALTARYCAQQGWPCSTVQSFYGGRRHDLFGIADTIVLHPFSELWVQNCSYGTLKAHRDAIEVNKTIEWCDAHAVSIQLWEWRKVKVGRKHLWRLRIQVRAYMRSPTDTSRPEWAEVGEWSDPIDLYPTKKAKRG